MTRRLRQVIAAMPFSDLFFIAGLCVTGYGILQFSKPGAIIFAGVAVCALAFLGQNKPVE